VTSLGLILALSLVVAWLVAAATTVRFVSRIWLRHWTELRLSGAHGAALFVERPQRLLLAAGTGIAVVVFAMGAIVGLLEDRQLLLRDLLLAVLFLLVIGQLIPRAVARRWAPQLAPVLLPALRGLDWLCAPLLAFAGRVVRGLTTRVAPSAPEAHDSLEDLLREGELEGVGEAAESAIITGVAEFGEKKVGAVMTPRAEIVAVERTTPPGDITRLIAQSKFSRIPVTEGGLDHIVGLVHSFDVLAHPDAPVASLRPVTTVGADLACHELMRRMLKDRVHLAVIRGAGGETVGVVTLEDLVEELVGEISDEHDEPRPVSP